MHVHCTIIPETKHVFRAFNCNILQCDSEANGKNENEKKRDTHRKENSFKNVQNK